MTSLSFASISSAPWPDRWKPSVRRWRLIFRLSDASRVWTGITACLGLAIYSASESVPLFRSTKRLHQARDYIVPACRSKAYCVAGESCRGRVVYVKTAGPGASSNTIDGLDKPPKLVLTRNIASGPIDYYTITRSYIRANSDKRD